MKFILILISFVSASAWAGGSGGGGVLGARTAQVNLGNGSGTLKAEMVRFVGMDRADLVFEYGQLNLKNELYTQTFKYRAEELSSEASVVLSAVELSKRSGDWVEVK